MTTNKTVNVTEFKAKCLALFGEVETGKVSITITRRGKPVAVVSPPPLKEKFKSTRGMWAGKLEIVGDIVNTDFSDLFDILNGRPDTGDALPSSAHESAAD